MPPVVHDEKMKINKEQLEQQEWLKNQLSDSSKEYIYALPKEMIYKVSLYSLTACLSFSIHVSRSVSFICDAAIV